MKKELNTADSKTLSAILDIMDAVPFYVILVDEHHYIIQANKAVRLHLGVNRRDIVGQYCPKVVHGINGPFDGCPLEESVETGQPVEKEVLDKESGYWLSSAIYPTNTFTEDGRKIFFHMVLDISARKRAEEKLKVSQKRLRSLSAHLESAVEVERKNISRELHDEISQVVTSINAHLAAAINTLPANTNQAMPLLKKAQDLSIQILDQVHRLIYQLRPTILDDFGLVAAIKWLLENNLLVVGVNVDFRVINKERTIADNIKVAVFRVIQEVISNISKHANAKNVVLHLYFKKSALKVRIKDDGIGFKIEEAVNSGDGPRGLGLVGMDERIRSFNGTFEIISSDKYGTKIIFEVPYENEVILK